jgi:hypothetical protein
MMKSSIAQALSILLVAASIVIAPKLSAQKSIYADYPQKKGKVQELQWDELPSWATVDFELRGRTEGQTAYSLTSGNGRLYELTRVHGGIEVRPTEHISAYLQFHDNHALGLPTDIVASNMRDAFDLRQGYVEFHYKPADLYIGRQELKFGSERLIGISDWTNNSRTFDGSAALPGAARTEDAGPGSGRSACRLATADVFRSIAALARSKTQAEQPRVYTG